MIVHLRCPALVTCFRRPITKLSRTNFKRRSWNMSDSSSATLVAPDPNLCMSCNNRLDYPCEIFKWIDCPRCVDQVYECESCEGSGESGIVLADGTGPPCDSCQGYGRHRGCPSCKRKGFFVATGLNNFRIQCEHCGGKGFRHCGRCNEHHRIRQHWGLCSGDIYYGSRRRHPKPSSNPRDVGLKEDWGELTIPYEPTQ